MKDRDVAFVLTSCGRFDLLEKTLTSFLEHNTYPITQYIIIEDSNNIDGLNQLLNKYPKINFTVLHNEVQQGQMKSVERAYQSVKCDYIFHMEDDWLFYRSGFIEDSFKVLDSDSKIMTVWLREPADTNDHPVLPEIYKTNDNSVDYQMMATNHQRGLKFWHGFTFNPGLRRFTDYQLIAPISDYAGEMEVSEFYYQNGFKAAIFPNGYVKHIGYHRGIRYNIKSPQIFKDIVMSYRKFKSYICKAIGL